MMRVILHIQSGPSAGKRLALRDGLTARIGRTEWADYSFPSDTQMAEVHFSLCCTDRGCQLKSEQRTVPTFVNEAAVETSQLHTGDVVRAGTTKFAIEIEGGASEDESTSDSVEDNAATAVVLAGGAVEVWKTLNLDPELAALAIESDESNKFVDRLRDEEQLIPAVRVQAHLLPKRKAIWWGLRCMDDVFQLQLPQSQVDALLATRNWVAEPSEEHRRACEAAADVTEYDGPGGVLAAAAFWSEGSLAPPESPEPVPPGELLTGQAVANALVLAGVRKHPELLEEKLKNCLKIAREVDDGKSTFPTLDTTSDD